MLKSLLRIARQYSHVEFTTLSVKPRSHVRIFLRLCSHGGWLLLKCSAVGIGFNGAETNCGIARILGILLMNSWDTFIYFKQLL